MWGEIWGCRLGMGGGSSKIMVGGGWWNARTFILSISWIFCKIYAPNLLCRWELSLPNIISPKSCEIYFYDFLAKNRFLLIFTYIFNTSKFARARRLYDVIVTSYEVQWYSFWYQWIEEVHTYTLVANIGVSRVPYRKSTEGVATTPLRRTCYKKYHRRTRVKSGRHEGKIKERFKETSQEVLGKNTKPQNHGLLQKCWKYVMKEGK